LVLLQDELNPIIAKLLSSGFEITAVRNHLLEESPRVKYMHYMGHGPAAQLATSLRVALAVSKIPLGKPAATTEKGAPPAWVKGVEDAVGRKGTYKGGVLSYDVARSAAVTMAGTTNPPAAGVAESINFQEAESGKVATTGDFVLTAEEVNAVISELHDHHISVTALHSHMLTEEPRLVFMYFWSVGTPESVGPCIKAALGKISLKG
jgi:uncharacterized protein DUF1259